MEFPKQSEMDVVEEQCDKGKYADLMAGRGGHGGGGLRRTFHGSMYQLRLCIAYFLHALQLPEDVDFGLASEHTDLDKYDDVVFKVVDRRTSLKAYHFIQAKHVQNEEGKEIKASDLIKSSNNNWGDRLTLTKYLKAHSQIIKLPGIDTSKRFFVICTNAGLDLDDLAKNGINASEVESHELNDIIGGCSSRCFRLDVKPTHPMFIKLKSQEAASKSPKGQLCEDDIEVFFSELILAVSFPNETYLGAIIKEKIKRIYNSIISDLMSDCLQNKMIDWLDKRTGEWLNREDGVRLLEDIRPKEDFFKSVGVSSHFLDELERSEAYLSNNTLTSVLKNFLSNRLENILQVVADPKLNYLTLHKLYQALQLCFNSEEFSGTVLLGTCPIFVDLTALIDNGFIINAFQNENSFTLLIVNCKAGVGIETVFSKLFDICNVNPNKKVILVSDVNIELSKHQAPDLEFKVKKVEDYGFCFRDLCDDTKKTLLQKNSIIIQENDGLKSIVSMFIDGMDSVELKNIKDGTIDPQTLERLIKGSEDIVVGRNAKDSNVLVSDIYIERLLKCNTTGKCDKAEHLEENELLENEEEQLVIIVNDAGSGKSTLVNSMCKKVRTKYPSSWICRLDLNDYVKIFKDDNSIQEMDDPVMFLMKRLLGAYEETKLVTTFERELFKLGFEGHIRLFLFFDGFDEICPNYQTLVIRLLSTLQQTRVQKIFVTTRPEEGRILMRHIKGVKYSIVPLSQEEQRFFLSQYWSKELGVDGVDEWIILGTVSYLGRKAGDRTNLSNPLTLAMVAECWRDIAYSSDNDKIDKEIVLSSIDKLQFRNLHKYFVDRKFELYAKEKCKITEGNISADVMYKRFIDEIRNIHGYIAMVEVVNRNLEGMMGENLRIDEGMKTALAKIGVVNQVGARYYFIHKTFGEYLVEEFIINNFHKVTPILNSKEWGEFMKSIGYKRADQLYELLINSRIEIVLKENKPFDEDVSFMTASLINANDSSDINKMHQVHGLLAVSEWIGPETAQKLTVRKMELGPNTKALLLKIGFVEQVDGGEFRFTVKWIYKNMKDKFLNLYVFGHHSCLAIIKAAFHKFRERAEKDSFFHRGPLFRLYRRLTLYKKLKDMHSYIAIEQRFGRSTATEIFGKELRIDESAKETLLNIGLANEREWWGRLVFPNFWFAEIFIYQYFEKHPRRIGNVKDVWVKQQLGKYVLTRETMSGILKFRFK